MWKKESFIKAGMWSEHLLLWQDIELHLRALLQHVMYVKRFDLQPDVFIRISDVSISRTGYQSLPKFLSHPPKRRLAAGHAAPQPRGWSR